MSGCYQSGLVVEHAVATLQPLNRSAVRGVVNFEQRNNQVNVTGLLKGLKPDETVYLAVYTNGDLSNKVGRFLGEPYGAQQPLKIKADRLGKALFEFTEVGYSLNDLDQSVLGRSVVVHSSIQDQNTPPFVSFRAAGVIGHKFIQPE